MNLNLLAEMAGLDPWEMRYRNAIRPGQVLPNEHTSFLGCEIIGVRVVAWWINASGPNSLESDGSHRQAETLVTLIDN